MGKVIIETGALANGSYLLKKEGPKQFSLEVASSFETLELTGNYSYLLQDGRWLESLVIKPSVNTTLRIGTTAGGQQLLPDVYLPAGIAEPILLPLYADGNKTVFIHGITASTIVKIFTK